ncbi:hypothetical protein [Hydrogenimonas sp.]
MYDEKIKYLSFSIVVFITMLLLFILAAVYNSDFIGFLTGNIIPELIGICIEVLIIIWVFEKWQKQRQHNIDTVNEKRLREYLIFFLKYGLKGLPSQYKIGNFYGQDHIENEKEITAIIQYLSANDIDIDLLKSMKNHLCIDKTAFENLLEVASLLTDNHFKAWIRIVYFINKISHIHGNNKNELKQSIIDILQNIKRFDKASYENNIYVGAKAL